LFKAEIELVDGERIRVYFANRLEIGYTGVKGTASVYDKLECLHPILNANSVQECREAVGGRKGVDG
jgi:hypothetical protein